MKYIVFEDGTCKYSERPELKGDDIFLPVDQGGVTKALMRLSDYRAYCAHQIAMENIEEIKKGTRDYFENMRGIKGCEQIVEYADKHILPYV